LCAVVSAATCIQQCNRVTFQVLAINIPEAPIYARVSHTVAEFPATRPRNSSGKLSGQSGGDKENGGKCASAS